MSSGGLAGRCGLSGDEGRKAREEPSKPPLPINKFRCTLQCEIETNFEQNVCRCFQASKRNFDDVTAVFFVFYYEYLDMFPC